MAAARPPPFFIAENLGLDFLNTLAVPVDTKVEWIASGEDLLVWLQHAGLVPRHVLEGLRKSALPGELDAVAGQARALRDWFKAFVYKYMGKPLEPKALRQLEPLNQLLARDEEFGQIVVRDRLSDGEHGPGRDGAGASRLALRPQRRWRSPETLLLPIARALADLVCTEFHPSESMRGADLHASLHRSHPRRCAPVVQHGSLRQSRETGRLPQACSASPEIARRQSPNSATAGASKI
jgi:Putative stress-induced transcription regulator